MQKYINTDYLPTCRGYIIMKNKQEYDTKGISAKCGRCEHRWTYHGKKENNNGNFPIYVCCPQCRTSVRLNNGGK